MLAPWLLAPALPRAGAAPPGAPSKSRPGKAPRGGGAQPPNSADRGYREVEISEPVEAARDAARRAYVPYSRFPVGAALLTGDGRVFQGVNVENASYGLTICAERTAAVKAVSEGVRDFRAVAVVAERAAPCPPCGACLQFLLEFNPRLPVILEDAAGRPLVRSLEELLAVPFGAGHLGTAGAAAKPGDGA
ncbi:MAG: cytidine deaminase [Firmicutes bacterium]|nr:cytidine deaminase [Bacillota bacterium]